jgi:hypothetical protein
MEHSQVRSCREPQRVTPIMKNSLTLVAVCGLALGGCALQPSPRAVVDPTPPAPQKEVDPLQRVQDERVRQRAEEIYRSQAEPNYSEAKQRAEAEVSKMFRGPGATAETNR